MPPSGDADVSVAPPHLSAAQVAAYVDGTVTGDERAYVEEHLLECDACREEVTACARLVSATPSLIAPGIRWRVAVPIAAALLAAVVLTRPDGSDRVGPALERGESPNASRIVLIAPPPGALVEAGVTLLVWRPIDRAAGYQVVVKDSTGGLLWRADVTDTSVALPRGLALRAGDAYVWRVDGGRTDGSTATSAETGFRIAP